MKQNEIKREENEIKAENKESSKNEAQMKKRRKIERYLFGI